MMAVSAGHEINIPDLEVNLQQLIIRHEFVHHEIRTLRQKRRREQIHETRMERTDVVLQGAVAVYCLSNYNIQLGLLYLKVFGEYPTDIPESFMEALLLDSFLETSLDDLFHLRHPISPSDERHRRSALQFLSEAHTVEWVEARNVLNGFAPSALDMFQIYKCHLLGTDEIDVRARAARKFATTMRKRWGLSFCLFQPHDETTQSERWEKVRSSDFIIV